MERLVEVLKLQEILVHQVNILAKAEIDSLAILISALWDMGQTSVLSLCTSSFHFVNPVGIALGFATEAEVQNGWKEELWVRQA